MPIWAPSIGPGGHTGIGMGAIWNFAKEEDSYSLAQNMGHKGPVIKA